MYSTHPWWKRENPLTPEELVPGRIFYFLWVGNQYKKVKLIRVSQDGNYALFSFVDEEGSANLSLDFVYRLSDIVTGRLMNEEKETDSED